MSEGLEASGATSGFHRTHRALLVLLWAHVPALALAGMALEAPVYGVAVSSLALVALALAAMAARSGRTVAITVSLGLLFASGALVLYSGGEAFSHFHLFLMICAISFYRDGVALSVGVLASGLFHFVHTSATSAPMPETVSLTVAVIALGLLLAVGWGLGVGREASDPSGDRFRMSFEGAPIGMAVLKPSGEFLEANRAMTEILRYGHADLVGSNVTNLVHVDDKDELGKAWEKMGNSNAHYAAEWMRCITSGGHPVWGKVSLSLVPRTDDHPAMVVLQFEDATHPYEEQRRLETLMKGKDEFVAAVGDEIREPLGLLIDLTDLAEHSHVDTRETLPRIEAHAREIASIVDDLVVSARAGTGAVSVASHVLDVSQICQEVIDGTPGAEEVTMDFRAVEVWGDPTLTRHVVGNLLGNAVRYGGSSIAVRTINSGPDTVIQVLDDGPELPDAERERMFTADLHNGPPVTRPATVGLSLAVSRHLARRMDGDLVYRRTGDGENIFELRLPTERINEIPRRRGVMGGTVPV